MVIVVVVVAVTCLASDVVVNSNFMELSSNIHWITLIDELFRERLPISIAFRLKKSVFVPTFDCIPHNNGIAQINDDYNILLNLLNILN